VILFITENIAYRYQGGILYMNKVKIGPQTLIYPKPAFLIGADVNKKPNFLAVAWGGIACGTPPMVSVAIKHSRYTLRGIKQNMAFSLNVTSRDYAVETDYCGITSGSKTDKVADCGFAVFYGNLAGAPMIEQYPVNLECKVVHIMDLGSHCLVIGEITETHVSQDCLTDGKPDVTKIQPVAYIEGQPGDYYCMGENIGKTFRIGKELKKK
jgi:flavin reductase (DIM6/NTAB) family NADH-FMN oxidoreductase RutF